MKSATFRKINVYNLNCLLLLYVLLPGISLLILKELRINVKSHAIGYLYVSDLVPCTIVVTVLCHPN